MAGYVKMGVVAYNHEKQSSEIYREIFNDLFKDDNIEFIISWSNVDELMNYIKNEGVSTINELEKILILDEGFQDRRYATKIVEKMISLQEIFEIKGVTYPYLTYATTMQDVFDIFKNNQDINGHIPLIYDKIRINKLKLDENESFNTSDIIQIILGVTDDTALTIKKQLKDDGTILLENFNKVKKGATENNIQDMLNNIRDGILSKTNKVDVDELKNKDKKTSSERQAIEKQEKEEIQNSLLKPHEQKKYDELGELKNNLLNNNQSNSTNYDSTSNNSTSYDSTSYDSTSYDLINDNSTSYDPTSNNSTSNNSTSYDSINNDKLSNNKLNDSELINNELSNDYIVDKKQNCITYDSEITNVEDLQKLFINEKINHYQKNNFDNLFSILQKVILFTGRTGTGITSTVYNLSKFLNNIDKKVLIINLDDYDDIIYYFDMFEKGFSQKNIKNVFRTNFASLNEITVNVDSNLDIISNIKTNQHEISLEDKYFNIKRIINVAKNIYDYILIDCNNHFNEFYSRFSNLIDNVVICTTYENLTKIDDFSSNQLKMNDNIENFIIEKRKYPTLLITKLEFKTNNKKIQNIINHLKTNLKHCKLAGTILYDKNWNLQQVSNVPYVFQNKNNYDYLKQIFLNLIV